MKTLTTTLVLVIVLFATQLFAQEVDTYKSSICTNKISSFPDSVLLYAYSFEGTRLGVAGKQYYSLNDNVLQVKYFADYANYSSYYLYAQDLYFYNKAGMADSAIIEASIDSDWDIYAIKKVYTYAGNLLTSELISWDQVDDSLNDDWKISKLIVYSYNDKNQVIDNITKYYSDSSYLDGFRTTSTYKVNDDGSSVRIDSSFMNDNYIRNDSTYWEPKGISYSYFNANGLCTNTKSWGFSPDSGIVELSTVITKMTYNKFGQLITEERGTPNTQPNYKTTYEYNEDDKVVSQTFYQIFVGETQKTYGYENFYKPVVIDSTEIIKVAANSTEIRDLEVSLYPNPANEILTILNDNNSTMVCRLYSSSGQIVKSLYVKHGENTYYIDNLRAGFYFLEIPSKNGMITKKMLKN